MLSHWNDYHSLKLLVLLVYLISYCLCFKFKYASVTFNPSDINIYSTYQLTLNRNIDNFFYSTTYSTSPVPTSSLIIITFPSQFDINTFDTFTCSYVMLDFVNVNSFSYSFDKAKRQVIINNVFLVDSYVAQVDIQLTNVKNPSTTAQTGPFIVQIGNDVSADDTKASISCTPSLLSNFAISFSNPIVNTTSNMILDLTLTNSLPVGGSIQLKFPSALKWSRRDVSFNNLFPIQGSLTCSGVSANVNSYILCSGLRSTQIVTFNLISSSAIAAGSQIKISLHNIFSPPTTQTNNTGDMLQISTYDQNNNEIDYQTGYISSLQPKVLSNLLIVPTSGQSNFKVNNVAGLNCSFTLMDTTTNQDNFQFIFQPNTIIIYKTFISVYKFQSITYNSTNSTLSFVQSSNSLTQSVTNNVSIAFINYQAPKSCRKQLIKLNIMKLGYYKMIGSYEINTQPNSYYLNSLSLNQSLINKNTILTINMAIKDIHSSSGMLFITLPQKIIVLPSLLSIQVTSSISTINKAQSTPGINYASYNQVVSSMTTKTTFTCTSITGCLWITQIGTLSNDVLPQTLNLIIGGFTNIPYVDNIDAIAIKTFYDAEFDSQVEDILQNTTQIQLKTTNGNIFIDNLLFQAPNINFKQGSLNIYVRNENIIPINGILQIYLPNQLLIQFSLNSSLHMSYDCTINNKPIFSSKSIVLAYISNTTYINQRYLLVINFLNQPLLTSDILSNSTIHIKLNSYILPINKQPIPLTNWMIFSKTSSLNLIDQYTFLSNNTLVLQNLSPNMFFTNIQIYRSVTDFTTLTYLKQTDIILQDNCKTNAQVCKSFVLKVNQQQPFISGNNGLKIQIGQQIDASGITNVKLLIGRQLTIINDQTISIYTPSSNVTIWISLNWSSTLQLNKSRSLRIILPSLGSLSSTIGLSAQQSARSQIPFKYNITSVYSQFFIILQTVKNPLSLSPFVLNLKTFLDSSNSIYQYSMGSSTVQSNTQTIGLQVQDYSFSNYLLEQQANVTLNVLLSNWNQGTGNTKSSVQNNVKYIILAIGSQFTFPNDFSIDQCSLTISTVAEFPLCTLQKISPNFSWTQKLNASSNSLISSCLNSSNYLIIITISDNFSTALQSLTNQLLQISFGSLINPNQSSLGLPSQFKTISVFTLSLGEYLIHNSLNQIVFKSNCTYPCRQCIFLTNNSTQISTQCKTCYGSDFLFNFTCIGACPNQTFSSSTLINSLSIAICSACLPSCSSCQNSIQCVTCMPSFKYGYLNKTSNLSLCVSACPSTSYFPSSSTNLNITTYTCLQCKTNCSTCFNASNCFRCLGVLVLKSHSCLEQCPLGTIQKIQNVSFLNTTLANVSVCEECAIVYNTNCLQCNQTFCITCQANYSLDLTTNKCVTTCANGYFTQTKILVAQNLTYSECSKCQSSCNTCNQSASNCTSCSWSITDTSLQYYLINNTCVSVTNCPLGFYPSTVTKSCSDCSIAITACLKCSSNNTCQECNLTAGYYSFANQSTMTTVCLNSSQVPQGFVLQNGGIVKCQSNCSSCSLTSLNCTKCISGYYYFSKITGGTCLSPCPSTYFPSNLTVCTSCPSPCYQCKINQSNASSASCLSCDSTSALYFFNSTCIDKAMCPNTTFPYTDTITGLSLCKACLGACYQCKIDGATCQTCKANYFYYNQTCLTKSQCPDGTVAVTASNSTNGTCINCVIGCQSCSSITSNCTACTSLYYYNKYTSSNQCITSCPAPLINSLPNSTSKQCLQCLSPCLTCLSTVTNCVTCQTNYYKLGNLCYAANKCPLGYWSNQTSMTCDQCMTSCANCALLSSALLCSSCITPKVLSNNSCIQSCPILRPYNVSGICRSCQQQIVGCLVCNSSKSSVLCLSCMYPYIYLNLSCILSCPSGYIFSASTYQCLSAQQNAQKTLSSSLTTNGVFPLPFSIICCFVVIACILSKLQNQNTYFIGTVYSMVGVVQVVMLGYQILVLMAYEDNNIATQLKPNYESVLLLFVISFLWIYGTNFLSMLVQTKMLSSDKQFQIYYQNNCLFYNIFIWLSFLINYKLKLVLFTRLFMFDSFSAKLQNIQQFKYFNIFSFIGIGYQGLTIYAAVILITRFSLTSQVILMIIDVIVVMVINLILAVWVAKKDQNFFLLRNQQQVVEDEREGSDKGQNTKIKNNKVDNQYGNNTFNQFLVGNKRQGLESHNNLMQQIYQDDQFSLSISRDQNDQNQISPRNNTSNQKLKPNNILNQKLTRIKNNEKKVEKNIFSPQNQQNNDQNIIIPELKQVSKQSQQNIIKQIHQANIKKRNNFISQYNNQSGIQNINLNNSTKGERSDQKLRISHGLQQQDQINQNSDNQNSIQKDKKQKNHQFYEFQQNQVAQKNIKASHNIVNITQQGIISQYQIYNAKPNNVKTQDIIQSQTTINKINYKNEIYGQQQINDNLNSKNEINKNNINKNEENIKIFSKQPQILDFAQLNNNPTQINIKQTYINKYVQTNLNIKKKQISQRQKKEKQVNPIHQIKIYKGLSILNNLTKQQPQQLDVVMLEKKNQQLKQLRRSRQSLESISKINRSRSRSKNKSIKKQPNTFSIQNYHNNHTNDSQQNNQSRQQTNQNDKSDINESNQQRNDIYYHKNEINLIKQIQSKKNSRQNNNIFQQEVSQQIQLQQQNAFVLNFQKSDFPQNNQSKYNDADITIDVSSLNRQNDQNRRYNQNMDNLITQRQQNKQKTVNKLQSNQIKDILDGSQIFKQGRPTTQRINQNPQQKNNQQSKPHLPIPKSQAKISSSISSLTQISPKKFLLQNAIKDSSSSSSSQIPFFKKNKQVQSSQYQQQQSGMIDFYNINDKDMKKKQTRKNYNHDQSFLTHQENKFNQIQKSQNNMSFDNNKFYDLNIEPSIPRISQNQRRPEKKTYQNDQLQKLIDSNKTQPQNKARLSASRQRQSIDRGQNLPKNRQSIDGGQNLSSSRRQQQKSITKPPRNTSAHQQDDLQSYYSRGRKNTQLNSSFQEQNGQRNNRSRSKSKERPMSRESQSKLKTLQKIYLQKLQFKK